MDWRVIFICLCALVVTVHSDLVTMGTLFDTSTNDTILVTTTEGYEPTTEGPLLPVKLLEMLVQSEVTLRYSRTAVTTLVRNPATRSQETTFRVLLPETAFISGFSMTIEGKKYDAYVKEKREAKQIYTAAVSHGLGAAHIAAKVRDSNHFTVTMNIEANSTATFNLTYEELLIRHNGLYSLGINLQPGSLVPNLTVIVHINEAQKITTLRVPEVSTGNEIVSTEGFSENSYANVTRSEDNRQATIEFLPDLDEQKRLLKLFAQKSRTPDAESGGVLGLFVVQYDVDRTVGNEILVNDGYFVHFFAPSNLTPLDKHVVFVLDISSSMFGRKIQQLRDAIQSILGELHHGDYFSIIIFDSNVQVLSLEESSLSLKVFQATEENISKAKTLVSNLMPRGLTNIFGALNLAISLFQEVVSMNKKKLNDMYTTIGNETLLDPESKNIQDQEGYEELEPIIIFLTDGQPNVGESNPKEIVNIISTKNSGERKASIFSLAFGEDADRSFLRELSLRNDGFMRHIYEASDAALQLSDFYQQITSPLLAHVNFTYPPDQIQQDSLTKTKFRTYFAGSEMIVAGRTLPSAKDISARVDARNSPDKNHQIIPLALSLPKEEHRDFYLPLERLWAYLTIKQLLEQRDAATSLDKPIDKDDNPEKKALDLALKYSFVTKLTSLVVVKPNDTKTVDAESVDKIRVASSSAYGRSYVPMRSAYSGPSSSFAAHSFNYGNPGLSGNIHPLLLSRPISSYGMRPAQHVSYPSSLSGAGLRPHSYPTSGFGTYTLTGSRPLPMGSSTTTPAITTVEPSTTVTTDPLTTYNLEQYSWTLSLLNASTDELVVKVNNTYVQLKLIKNGEDSLASSEATACGPATDGAAGECLYLTRCETARNITAELYSSVYCLVQNQYAGVCCPKVNTITTMSTTEAVSSASANN